MFPILWGLWFGFAFVLTINPDLKVEYLWLIMWIWFATLMVPVVREVISFIRAEKPFLSVECSVCQTVREFHRQSDAESVFEGLVYPGNRAKPYCKECHAFLTFPIEASQQFKDWNAKRLRKEAVIEAAKEYNAFWTEKTKE